VAVALWNLGAGCYYLYKFTSIEKFCIKAPQPCGTMEPAVVKRGYGEIGN